MTPEPAGQEISAAKRALRTDVLSRRAAVAAAGIGLGRQASGHLIAVLGAVRPGAAVSGYLAGEDEIDPMPAMLTLRAMGHPVCVPVTEGRGTALRFRAWHPGVPLELGPFRIPVPTQGEWIVPEVLIVPLVAFDRQGYRLGYGGGYYDRTLAALRPAGRVTAIGFAFAAQEVPEVPVGPHDAKLDAIVTERGVVDLC